MNFKTELLKNRYLCYRKNIEKSPFFDPELNSHIVLKYGDVASMLKSSELSSNRKKHQFDQLRQCPFSNGIVDFYDQWLMYMDGYAHSEARRLISSSLSRATKKIDETVNSAFSEHVEKVLLSGNRNLDIVESITTPFVIRVLAHVLGIQYEAYKSIIDVSKPIVMFLGNGDIGNAVERMKVLDCLTETQDLLIKCIQDCNNNESVIGYLLREEINVKDIYPLLINVIIDGFDPLSSIINNYFNIISNNTTLPDNITPNELFDEIIRLEPPFQYCARIATEDILIGNYKIRKNERVMSFISAANRDPNIFEFCDEIKSRGKEFKHLSFGAGMHLCSGANLSKKIANNFFLKMSNLNKRIHLDNIDETWIDTVGYRMLKTLIVKIEERSVKNV